MRDLEDVARHEVESTAVDFKAAQYPSEKHDRLLVDIVAMANADIAGERLIVIGINLKPNGERQFLGIDPLEFRDAAIYQQLVRENIEPELSVEYLPLELDEGLFGVLRISGCSDPPYLLSKDFRKLHRGTGFIRKGTHQTRLTRRDLDRMKARARPEADLLQVLELSFVEGEPRGELLLTPTDPSSLPSVRAAARIKEILAERQRIAASESPYGWRVFQSLPRMNFGLGRRPYEQRPTEELVKALEEIEETYRDEDLYELFEQRSSRVNLYLYNHGERYVENASIRLIFPATDGLVIPDKVAPEPQKYDGLGVPIPNVGSLWTKYPEVRKTEAGETLVTADVGDVRHGLWTPVFEESLRMLAHPDLAGARLEVAFAVHAKNLPDPFRGTLVLAIRDG